MTEASLAMPMKRPADLFGGPLIPAEGGLAVRLTAVV
jgi:hypothetical protein